MYAKGNQKPSSRSTVLPKKAVQNKFHPECVSDPRFVRLDSAYLTDTYTGNTNPLFHSL